MNLDGQLANAFNIENTTLISENTEFGFAIHLIEASKSRPYKVLHTVGLSQYNQPVSDRFPEYKNIELYICLPDYWNLETNDWPITWLNALAEVPQKKMTWFGPGDTIPAGNPVKPIDEKFTQNHFMLVEPMLFKNELNGLKKGENDISFLAVIPIYQEELEYKLRSSAKVFLAKYQFKKYNELVDEYRDNVSKSTKFKKIGWYFVMLMSLLLLVLIGYWFFSDKSQLKTTPPHQNVEVVDSLQSSPLE